jgi:DNA invertase Pin-like site-specific DNA recombinase
MTHYVAYLRVSTARQGRTGLGLAAQRSLLERFLSDGDQLIAEFVEIQSGRVDAREELWKAINHAKRNDSKLLIAKLDRFSRKVSFIANIMEQGIELVVAEMPNATDFQLHIHAALAQEERRLISERTRIALAEAKKRGVVLGANGRRLAASNRLRAVEYARQMEPMMRPLLDQGHSFCQVARTLNNQGIRTSKGARFFPGTVSGIVRRWAAQG